MSAALVYMIAADKQEAGRIAATLLEQRLVACVNVLGTAESFFTWHGAVQNEAETVFVAKTRAELVPQLTTAVRGAHSYECPCVVALPIIDGDPEFIAWIHDATQDAAASS